MAYIELVDRDPTAKPRPIKKEVEEEAEGAEGTTPGTATPDQPPLPSAPAS